ncbi:MAG: DUF2868 domain-containing protein, partial [Phycisphaerales bacterium]|nr:DUF2868 domain-containing protein [Phycisphaerales bacterium]
VAATGMMVLGLGIIGAFIGFTTTGELLRHDNGPVHAAAALVIIAGAPWLLIAIRTFIVAALRRRAGGLIGRLVPGTLRTVATRNRGPEDERLSFAIAQQLGRMLAGPAGRWLATLGSGAFWCGYAIAAFLAIWFFSARVALGFGWESSWLPPELGRSVAMATSAPLKPILGEFELIPVEAPPTAAADDPTALERRRTWVTYLSGGVAIYLLLPMGAWTILAAGLGHLAAERWRPSDEAGSDLTPPRPGSPPEPKSPNLPLNSNASAITCIVGLERPTNAPWPPPSMGETQVMNIVNNHESRDAAIASLQSERPRTAIIGWLPSSPDRGVERLVSSLTSACGGDAILILDGGDALRTREAIDNVRIRHADWLNLAAACKLPVAEFDFQHLSSEARSSWMSLLGGEADPVDTGPQNLDASFAAISRALEDTPPLPAEETARKLAAEITKINGVEATGLMSSFSNRLTAAGRDPIAAARAIAEQGRGWLPPSLRSNAQWAAIGGVLGAFACIGATIAAPAAAVALPAWAMSGAGLGGVLGLLRSRDEDANSADDASRNDPLELGECVISAAMLAVVLWKQGAGETAINDALLLLADEDDPPVLEDAAAARNWLAVARRRLVEGGDR